MKINKILIIVQLSFMYASQLLMLFSGMILSSGDEVFIEILRVLFFTGVIMGLATTFLSTFILIPIIISIFKKDNEDMTKFTMIIKLVSIPWYVINFILCVFVIAGMLNPFLLIGMPLMVVFLISITYTNMVVVSANNIAVIISEFKNRILKPNPLLITGIVFHFIFCLDVLGALFTFINYQKLDKRS